MGVFKIAIITDIPWVNKTTGETHKGFYMDKWLAQNLEKIPSHLKKGWDVVAIMSGSGLVRVGKTVSNETCTRILENGKIVDSKPLGSYKDGTILNTLSWDFNNKKMVASKSEVIIEKEKKKFYNVELIDGKKICCTLDHKLFIRRLINDTQDKKVWKIIELKLRDIKEGDELVCQSIK